MKKIPRPHLLNILNYKLYTLKNKKYLNHINSLISNTEFIKQLKKNIKIDFLDTFIFSTNYNELFTINDNGTIKFLHYQNLIQFNFKKNSLTKELVGILNINIKNKQCYELIITIIQLQKKFLLSNNKQDLKYFSHKDILLFHQKQFNTSLVSSNISTISHNTFFRDRNNNIKKLNYLFPKKHFVVYIHIKYLLNKYVNLTDIKLSYYLENEFNIKIDKSKVYEVRKRYFIPSRINRNENIYLEYKKKYSISYQLNLKNLIKLNNIKAVYELRSINSYLYNYKATKTVYIGSTNNLKRRLTQYITDFGHTKQIKEFINNGDVSFRIIKTENHKDLEKDVLEAFYSTYGNYPKLNSYKVR